MNIKLMRIMSEWWNLSKKWLQTKSKNHKSHLRHLWKGRMNLDSSQQLPKRLKWLLKMFQSSKELKLKKKSSPLLKRKLFLIRRPWMSKSSKLLNQMKRFKHHPKSSMLSHNRRLPWLNLKKPPAQSITSKREHREAFVDPFLRPRWAVITFKRLL